MNPIIQKLDYNSFFDRQLEAYVRFTTTELGKIPPDFEKLSRAKEDFRDNVFNRLIKMINQNTQVIEPVTGELLYLWIREYISDTPINIDMYNNIFKEKHVCYIKT